MRLLAVDWVWGVVVVSLAAGTVAVAQQPGRAQFLRERLTAALADQDAAAIHRAVADINRHLGDKAGIPEVADTFIPIPAKGAWLTADEAKAGGERLLAVLEKQRWWRIGLDPTKLDRPLREPAAAISGCLAVCRAGLGGRERCLALAKEAGDFLLWAQEQGGTGVFPFPASRGDSRSAPFQAAEKLLNRAEKDGRLELAVRRGWLVDDLGDGGLQFDNGECGVALLELYEYTNEAKYLEAARESADWALARPLVGNWNYNSFSVYLLAKMYDATGDVKYLEAAVQKAVLGVMPGQLTEGPLVGRWHDPHNARPGYHYIMLRSLAALAHALPDGDAARPEVLKALRLGLAAQNVDFRDRGAPNKDKAMEVLLAVNRAFADDPAFLRETSSAEALDALAKLVSEQARRGSLPLGPCEWGHFLEYVMRRSGR